MKPTRPIVRYHGGKWKMAPKIIPLFPPHRVYVEPFGGGGSVLIRKPRSYAEIYNDLDGEIVNLFRVARDHGEELVRRIELTPFARDEFDLSYEPSEDPVEQARRTMIRGFMGFGSTGTSSISKTGFRANSNRSGTTPARDWLNLPNAIERITKRLQGVVIENRDAIEVMQMQDEPSTLHYVDPPYVASTRTWNCSKQAYKHEMTDDQHRELADALRSLKGMVVLSGYPSDLYQELFQGWECRTFDALGDRASKRTECVWLSPIAVLAQQPVLAGL